MVFVSATKTTSCGPTTGAHAVTCGRDEANWYNLKERPLVGYINFCPPASDNPAAKGEDALVDTAVHELIHTLFMSSNLYPHYITRDGRPLGCACQLPAQCSAELACDRPARKWAYCLFRPNSSRQLSVLL